MAKRFYDMAAETSADAHLPVNIVLFKLHLELLWERIRSVFSFSSGSSSTSTKPPDSSTTGPETDSTSQNSAEVDSLWDLYLMAALLIFIGALYTMLRQRAAAQARQAPLQ